jgi:hypothetical protein
MRCACISCHCSSSARCFGQPLSSALHAAAPNSHTPHAECLPAGASAVQPLDPRALCAARRVLPAAARWPLPPLCVASRCSLILHQSALQSVHICARSTPRRACARHPVAFLPRLPRPRAFFGHSFSISASCGLRLALARCQLPITRSVRAVGALRALVVVHGPAFCNFCRHTDTQTIKGLGTIPVVPTEGIKHPGTIPVVPTEGIKY